MKRARRPALCEPVLQALRERRERHRQGLCGKGAGVGGLAHDLGKREAFVQRALGQLLAEGRVVVVSRGWPAGHLTYDLPEAP